MLFHRNSTCFLLRISLVFLCFVLFYWIIGCVWSSALFVFIIFAALQECCFRFCRQAVFFYYCGVGCLMWAGLSMSFCGGYGIGFYGFCFATDVETSFARQNNRAHRTVCCCMCSAAMFLFVFVLSLFACQNAEYAKLCESNKPLCGETDRRTLCRDDVSIFGAVIGERFAFLCGGERRCGLIVRIWVPVARFVLRFARTEMVCFACKWLRARLYGEQAAASLCLMRMRM